MAAFFWIHAGANNNWATNGNWSATSGGGTNAAQPSVTSDVTFDGVGANGNDASTVSATQSVLSLTFTSGYTQTVTVSAVLTIAGNFTDNTAHSWAGSSAMTISAASTITSGGKTWPNSVTFSNANTKTLSGDWTITGTLTVTAATTVNSNTLTIGGGITNNTGIVSGTTAFVLNGTGTLSASQAIRITSLTINTAGTITLGATLSFDTGTLTYIAGTVVTTSNTLTMAASTTLNTAGITWNNITNNGSGLTFTLNSLLSATGTLTLGAFASTWAGTAGFTVGTLTHTGASALTITLANTVTYTITTAFTAFNSRTGSILLFTSDHASNRANIVLQNASTSCNVLASFTRINAGAGRPIISFNGTITDCINVVSQSNVLYMPVTTYNRGGRRVGLTDKNKAVMYQ